MTRFALLGCAIVAVLTAGVSADVIAYEDFDGGAFNLIGSTNVLDYNAGGGSGGDVFGRVGPFYLGDPGMPYDMGDDTVADVSGGGVYIADALALAGQYTTAFFGLNDMDGPDGPGFTFAEWSFDISSAATIDGVQIDIGALGDFETASSDGFMIEAQVDGGGYVQIFRGETDEAAFYTYRPFDNGFIFSDDDPLMLYIDGVAANYLDKSDPATGAFDTYLSTLLAGNLGSQLDVRISWQGTPSGSEPMGIDNISIIGTVPEPATLALLGLGGLALLGSRRRG